eukprot:28382_4
MTCCPEYAMNRHVLFALLYRSIRTAFGVLGVQAFLSYLMMAMTFATEDSAMGNCVWGLWDLVF